MGLWIDMLIVLIVGIVTYIQSKRGLIPALMEFIGVYGILVLVNVIDGPVARTVALFSRPETNLAFFHILLFVVLCVPVVMLGVFMDHAVPLSLETLDTIVGGGFGLLAGVVICHAVIGGLVIGATPGGTVHLSIADSQLASEVLHLAGWHSFTEAVERMGTYDQPY